MNDQQLLRYSRQILLDEISISGQQALLDAKVLIIGMGGLGSPVAMYLAAAGIGELSLVDFDSVELSNLQRQIIHNTHSLGKPKVESAKQTTQAINPDIKIHPINRKLNTADLQILIQQHDVVVDCSDNFTTRFEINHACVKAGKPLVSGAVIRMQGQVTCFDLHQPDSPCYRCLYSEDGEIEESCSNNGILAPVAGIIGSIQATEVIKLIVGLPTLTGKFLVLDAKHMQWRMITLKKDTQCPECAKSKQT